MNKLTLPILCTLCALFFSIISFAQVSDTLITEETDSIALPQYKIGDMRSGSFSKSVHVIKLIDEDGYTVHREDDLLLPFSTKNTCGECHSYEIIKDGFHFNGGIGDSIRSRNAEPFIYFDPYTLTVLPLSYRNWDNTFHPDKVQLSPMKFMDVFGSHYTGGAISEVDSLEYPDNFFRWMVSGKLEINCLICHDADPAYDAAEYSSQTLKQNYKWAATASSSFAEVKGSAKKMPDNFDPHNTNTFVDNDLRTSPPPTVNYDFSKFNSDSKVFFDIDRVVPKEKCYYCHSSVVSNETSEKFLSVKEDVHLKAGMTCVDCHRNDLTHDIIRGSDDEWRIKGNPELAAYSCEGCHVGNNESSFPSGGSFGAPKPEHKGIPSVHFGKLSCTVCHSGNWPQDKTSLVKTSRAHKLGSHFAFKSNDAYPHIQTPVYVRNSSGKIEPRNLLWPSYWGVQLNGEVQPLDIKTLDNNLRSIMNLDSLLMEGIIPKLSDSLLITILSELSENIDGEPVYVSGGNIFSLSEEDNLVITEAEKIEPYSWPIAHTVRPASQSLGVRGCGDCHSVNSNFFFSKIETDSFVENATITTKSMTSYQGLNSLYQQIFSFSFFFRPLLKIIIIISCALILLTVVIFLSRGIFTLSKYASENSISSNNERDV